MACLIEFLLSSVEEFELGLLDLDFGIKTGNFSLEDGDFVLSLILGVGVVDDAAIELGNGVGTFLFLLVVKGIRFSLLGH